MEIEQRFPRRGGRVLGVHGAGEIAAYAIAAAGRTTLPNARHVDSDYRAKTAQLSLTGVSDTL